MVKGTVLHGYGKLKPIPIPEQTRDTLSWVYPYPCHALPIAFHSHTFLGAKLNYDIHDKELLVIFEAFKIWCHYLEGLGNPINVVTDHTNLEYFSTTKVLTCCQVHWSKYLSAFNLVIHIHPGHLSMKPDALTR